jgi:hypothetical protein
MNHFITAGGAAIVTALILPAAAQSLSKDVAARIEAIPIQTLTISDEQFLKGDAYGKPTKSLGCCESLKVLDVFLSSFLLLVQAVLDPSQMYGTGNLPRWEFPHSRWIRLQGVGS